MDEQQHRIRFADADWYDPKYTVTVGGAGSIGSWLLLFLSRIGFEIILYEMDIVETNNIGGQLYGQSDIGSTKAEAIQEKMADLALHEDIQAMGKYEEDCAISPIAMSCFDNMKARKNMFNKWLEVISDISDDTLKVFIDGRLTAESLQMYIVQDKTEDVTAYEETLFGDEEVEDLPCSYKSTSHIAAMLASQMTTGLTNAITNHKGELSGMGRYRDIPFETKFEASLFLYEQENISDRDLGVIGDNEQDGVDQHVGNNTREPTKQL